MKELITYLIASGGLGFFNLYVAQESDLLYFGKYNKEERLAWLSIYSIINFIMFKFGISYFELHEHVVDKVIIFLIGLVTNLAVTFVLPLIVNQIINIVRHAMQLGNRAYLPPLNTFFQDIKDFELFVYDFDGKLINHGKIKQGTEERQIELSVLLYPTTPDEKFDTYAEIMKTLSDSKQRVDYEEYTDYDRKFHFVKVKVKQN